MPTLETLNKGDYVLVQYKMKRSVVQYVGVIEKVGDNGYDEVEIKFLTRKPSKYKKASLFNFPDEDDVDVDLSQYF